MHKPPLLNTFFFASRSIPCIFFLWCLINIKSLACWNFFCCHLYGLTCFDSHCHFSSTYSLASANDSLCCRQILDTAHSHNSQYSLIYLDFSHSRDFHLARHRSIMFSYQVLLAMQPFSPLHYRNIFL
uniref:Uncharacterized protein n=1 Tax=Octopus bimaculoides TaxID=37653 RepID=A0A0L8GQN3_OCTBM